MKKVTFRIIFMLLICVVGQVALKRDVLATSGSWVRGPVTMLGNVFNDGPNGGWFEPLGRRVRGTSGVYAPAAANSLQVQITMLDRCGSTTPWHLMAQDTKRVTWAYDTGNLYLTGYYLDCGQGGATHEYNVFTLHLYSLPNLGVSENHSLSCGATC